MDMSNLGTPCNFEHDGNNVDGTCFGATPGEQACVANCSPATADPATGVVTAATLCANNNSTCQATGAIGAAGTIGVCIPATTFAAAGDCPSGTHPMVQADG